MGKERLIRKLTPVFNGGFGLEQTVAEIPNFTRYFNPTFATLQSQDFRDLASC